MHRAFELLPIQNVKCCIQGDQIGRLFALGSFFENYKSSPNFLGKRYALILTKKIGWATFWPIFYANSSGPPGCIKYNIAIRGFEPHSVFLLSHLLSFRAFYLSCDWMYIHIRNCTQRRFLSCQSVRQSII
jgi:hypothetical protein